MANQEYCGYTNYATWNVCLWIDNDESMYHAKLATIKAMVGHPMGITAELAEQVAAEILGDHNTPDLSYHEGHAWDDVNWDEIAKEWTIEAKEALDWAS